jgi:Short C-terminal domain
MPLMRRRPLLRAAAVGGGAYVAGKHTANNRQREAEQEQRIGELEDQSQPAPAAAPPAAAAAPAGGLSQTMLTQLKQLGELHDQGVLTDEEFAQQKQRCLAGA